MFQQRYVADVVKLQEALDKFVDECCIIPILNTEDLVKEGIIVPMRIGDLEGINERVDMIEINIDTLMEVIKLSITAKRAIRLSDSNIRLINPN